MRFLKKSQDTILLLFSIVITIFLYGYNIKLRSYTADELGTILISKMPVCDIMAVVKKSDIHPPTHYLLVHYWAKLFGDDLASMRVSGIIPILLLIPISYCFTKRYFSKKVAYYLIPFLIVSPNLLYYSRIVRYYSWTLLFAFLSIASFIWFFETRQKRSRVSFIVATAILGYLHYFTIIIVLISENIYFAIRYKTKAFSRKETYCWLRMQVILLMLLFPMILFITIPQFTHFFSAEEITASSNMSVNWKGMFAAMLYPFYAFWFSQNFFPWEYGYTIPCLVALILLLSPVLKYFKKNLHQFMFVIVFIFMPVTLVSAAMFITRVSQAIVQSAAYSLFVLLFILIILCALLSAFGNKPLKYVIYFGLIILNVLSIRNYFAYHTALCWDPNWQEVAEYIGENSNPSDLIVAINPEHNIIEKSYVSYYLHQPTIDVMQNSLLISYDHKASGGLKEFRRVLFSRPPERVWVTVRNRLPGEAFLVEKSLADMGYIKEKVKGFWRNDKNTIKFKKILSGFPFLGFRANDVEEFMISVILYKY